MIVCSRFCMPELVKKHRISSALGMQISRVLRGRTRLPCHAPCFPAAAITLRALASNFVRGVHECLHQFVKVCMDRLDRCHLRTESRYEHLDYAGADSFLSLSTHLMTSAMVLTLTRFSWKPSLHPVTAPRFFASPLYLLSSVNNHGHLSLARDLQVLLCVPCGPYTFFRRTYDPIKVRRSPTSQARVTGQSHVFSRVIRPLLTCCTSPLASSKTNLRSAVCGG